MQIVLFRGCVSNTRREEQNIFDILHDEVIGILLWGKHARTIQPYNVWMRLDGRITEHTEKITGTLVG